MRISDWSSDVCSSDLLLGTVGHFGADKGVDLAIGVFQAFLRRNPGRDARLLVLGRGDPAQESEMRSLVAPEFTARIGFVGFQTDPVRWFPGFDVLLTDRKSVGSGQSVLLRVDTGGLGI